MEKLSLIRMEKLSLEGMGNTERRYSLHLLKSWITNFYLLYWRLLNCNLYSGKLRLGKKSK